MAEILKTSEAVWSLIVQCISKLIFIYAISSVYFVFYEHLWM